MALHLLGPRQIGLLFGDTDIGTPWSLTVFGWISVLQALYTLVVSTPIEVSVYRAFQVWPICKLFSIRGVIEGGLGLTNFWNNKNE